MQNKCNHLVPKEHTESKCDPVDPNSKMHFWVTTGRLETMFNGMISVDFRCKNCNKRVTSFLTHDEYLLNRRLLNNKWGLDVFFITTK